MIELIPSEINGYYAPADPGEPGQGPIGRLSINDDESEILTELARGRRVLEIGTGLGVSTRGLAHSAIEVVTVDIDPWVKSNIAPNLPANVKFMSSLPVGIFDMVFIDGAHDFESVKRDISAALKRLTHHGFLVLHDYHMLNIMAAAVANQIAIIPIKTKAGMGLHIVP